MGDVADDTRGQVPSRSVDGPCVQPQRVVGDETEEVAGEHTLAPLGAPDDRVIEVIAVGVLEPRLPLEASEAREWISNRSIHARGRLAVELREVLLEEHAGE